jgi:hypothetical protein
VVRIVGIQLGAQCWGWAVADEVCVRRAWLGGGIDGCCACHDVTFALCVRSG